MSPEFSTQEGKGEDLGSRRGALAFVLLSFCSVANPVSNAGLYVCVITAKPQPREALLELSTTHTSVRVVVSLGGDTQSILIPFLPAFYLGHSELVFSTTQLSRVLSVLGAEKVLEKLEVCRKALFLCLGAETQSCPGTSPSRSLIPWVCESSHHFLHLEAAVLGDAAFLCPQLQPSSPAVAVTPPEFFSNQPGLVRYAVRVLDLGSLQQRPAVSITVSCPLTGQREVVTARAVAGEQPAGECPRLDRLRCPSSARFTAAGPVLR